jgi:hypothetical protein
MATVTEKYAAILTKKQLKSEVVAEVLEKFFQERLNEIEGNVDDLIVQQRRVKKPSLMN